MALSISGMSSGLDTASIIAQLMQVERIPQGKLQQAGAAAQKQVTAWGDLRTKVQALQTAAEALRTPAKALAPVATSSHASALRVTAQDTAQLGQTTLTVKQLATAQSRRIDGLGPADMTVGAGTTVLTSGKLGTQTAADVLDLSGASAGVHTVQVVRASSAATAYGTAALSLSATDLTVALDGGTARSLTLQSSYATTADLVTDLQTQLSSAFGTAVQVREVAGRLELRTAAEGSARSLSFGGGAAAALALPTSPVTGTSALVSVNGTRQEVEPDADGGTTAVALGTTGIVLNVGASLGAGTIRTNVVTTTDTHTLADLAGMLSAVGSPVSATLVKDEAGGSSLLMTATSTGTDGAVAISPGHSALTAGTAGTTHTTTAGKDAQVEIGGVLSTRSSNTISDLVPGVTLDLVFPPKNAVTGADEPVTVSVSRDSAGTKDRVKALVDAANALLKSVKDATKYDVATRAGGPLVGSSVARTLSSSVLGQFGSFAGSGELRTLSQIGVQTTRDGTLTFDAAVLAKAVETSPDDVARSVAALADGMATWAKETSRTGGVLTAQRDGADAVVQQRRRQAEAMETRLERTEARFRRQFTALETAMSRLNSQSASLGAALTGMLG